MLRILFLALCMNFLLAEEPTVRLNAIPMELRGTYVVTHQSEFERGAAIPNIDRVDRLTRLEVQYEIEVDGQGFTFNQTYFPAADIYRSGPAIMWTHGDELVMFGHSKVPGYNIMFVINSAKTMVALCRR